MILRCQIYNPKCYNHLKRVPFGKKKYNTFMHDLECLRNIESQFQLDILNLMMILNPKIYPGFNFN